MAQNKTLHLSRRAILTASATTALATATMAAQAQTKVAGLAIDGLRGSIDATLLGASPNLGSDQTEVLQNALNAAAGVGNPLFLPPGRYFVTSLSLPESAHIVGIPGATVLSSLSGRPIIRGEALRHASLTGITLDGLGMPMDADDGIVTLRTAKQLSIRDCTIMGSGANGIRLSGVAGLIENTTISDCELAGLFSMDAIGLRITGNTVYGCRNNGILAWRSVSGHDGTIIQSNRIYGIQAKRGGSGQNGNGINVFRADNVIVSNNQIDDCEFTAVRGNAASNIQISDNNCRRLGEVAIYSEFAYEGAVIANNIVDDAATGISITNFNDGGRLAVCTGNLVRNMKTRDHFDARGVGIFVEADTVVNANTVENAPIMGIGLGWGAFMRDVSATSNIVRQSPIGIGVSVSQNAGTATIANNVISGATTGAILGMDFGTVVTKDLASNEDARFPQLAVSRNTVAG